MEVIPSTSLLIATSNPGKAHEIKAALDGLAINVKSLCDGKRLNSPTEDADTFIGNARLKALHYARLCDDWTLADDSGLAVDALDGAPGVYSARFAGSDAHDSDNNDKLLHLLADTPTQARTAHFVCALALAHKNRILAQVQGKVSGMILTVARGNNGFGYDPLFYVPMLRRTMAELSAEQKNEISHRGQAVSAMRAKIQDILKR